MEPAGAIDPSQGLSTRINVWSTLQQFHVIPKTKVPVLSGNGAPSKRSKPDRGIQGLRSATAVRVLHTSAVHLDSCLHQAPAPMTVSQRYKGCDIAIGKQPVVSCARLPENSKACFQARTWELARNNGAVKEQGFPVCVQQSCCRLPA